VGPGVRGKGRDLCCEASTMDHDRYAYRRARELRREMTPAERIVWKQLRDRRFAGFKFRRQQPIGPYIVDFFCASRRLVVELDGETHLGKEVNDQIRQGYLERQGLRVLRFWNTEVYETSSRSSRRSGTPASSQRA
jgi:very-short-patch-repair endonuclease